MSPRLNEGLPLSQTQRTAQKEVAKATTDLTARLAEAEHLLRRLSEWDHWPGLGSDGPYWQAEIRAFLKEPK